MMSAQTIKDISDVAAYRAAEEGRVPLNLWSEKDAQHIPFLGDFVPAGWRIATYAEMPIAEPRNVWNPRPDEEVNFMVDASGFGSSNEPALTVDEFKEYAMASGLAWAIRETGQFQVVVSPYVEDAGSPGTPAPSEESVTCDRCHTVHDDMEECDEDGVEKCPACGDPTDYCTGHGEIGDPEGFAILALHALDDHTDCDPNGCGSAGYDYSEPPVAGQEGLGL